MYEEHWMRGKREEDLTRERRGFGVAAWLRRAECEVSGLENRHHAPRLGTSMH